MSNAKKNAKNPEEMQAALQALINQGHKEGMVRASELNSLLEKLDLTAEQARQVAINAASAAFVDEDDRQLLLEQIEEIFA